MRRYSASPAATRAYLRKETILAGARVQQAMQDAAGGITGNGHAGYQKNGEQSPARLCSELLANPGNPRQRSR